MMVVEAFKTYTPIGVKYLMFMNMYFHTSAINIARGEMIVIVSTYANDTPSMFLGSILPWLYSI